MNPRKFDSLFLVSLVFLGAALPVSGAVSSKSMLDRPVTVSGNGKSHTIAVLGKDGNVWTETWSGRSEPGGPVGGWSGWTRQTDLVLGDGKIVSSPWLQAPNGAGVINLFALGRGDSARRICQWTRFSQAFQGSNGIPDADSVATSLASAQTGSGWQTLFAIFADSTLRYRQWDSVNWVWSGWKILGTGFALLPPYATQVTATDVNVYATRPDGIVIQNWWNGSYWSGWVIPPWQKVSSSPASVNFDWTTHLLFARDSAGKAVGAIWNGSYWTALPPSGIPVLSGLSAVVVDTDSVLVYAKAPDSSLIRFSWSRTHSWGAVEHLDGPGCQTHPIESTPSKSLMDRPVTVSGNGKSHTIAVLGKDGNVWTETWSGRSEPGRPVGGWSCWNRQTDLVLGDGKVVSAPWLQAPNGAGAINLFALGQGNEARRICQWTRFSQAFQGTNGIPDADSVATSLASAQTGSGWQTLFAIFADSTLRYRQWDSVNWVWSGWKILGTGFALLPPYATQVTATDVNVYATRPDGIVIQNWWNGVTWSGWVIPPWQKVASSPASVNFDWTTHLLFARDSVGTAVGAIWNGSYWTALPPSGIPVLSGLSAVVVDTDSVLVYAKAPDSALIRFPWSRTHSWGAVEHLEGPGTCRTTSVNTVAPHPLRELRWESGALRLPRDLAATGGNLGIFTLDGRREANLSWRPGQASVRANLRSGLHQVRMESGSTILFVP